MLPPASLPLLILLGSLFMALNLRCSFPVDFTLVFCLSLSLSPSVSFSSASPPQPPTLLRSYPLVSLAASLKPILLFKIFVLGYS